MSLRRSTSSATLKAHEIEFVEHEPDVLRGRVKTIVLETHSDFRGEDRIAAMLATLVRLGFERLEPLSGGKARSLPCSTAVCEAGDGCVG